MSVPPDFVIAGAPKSGTTALYEYLSRHPEIFMPRIKEPKYFCSDLKTTDGVYTLTEYRQLFAAAPAHCLTGDASALYMYSKVAIERIMENNPRTKVIVMLRHPVEAAHSLYAARWSHHVENIASFEQAWRAQTARLTGELLPPRWPDPLTLQYGSMYCYAQQVHRLLQRVPASQRHIVVFEEFFAAPHRHYAELVRFLSVSPDERCEFPVVNPTTGARSERVEELLRTPPAWLRAAYRPIRPLFRATRVRPWSILRNLNSTSVRKPLLTSSPFRAEMERYFASDISQLEAMLGRPLWRQSGSAP
jgi:hypothetical protein